MDKMREELRRFCDDNLIESSDEKRAAVLVWQHLYPMVEAAYVEGWSDGFEECADQHDITLKVLPKAEWQDSTAKARLEGKDD